jgi:trypsin-like peptidase
MSDEYAEWTPDELLAELRGRERARAASPKGRVEGMPAAMPAGEPTTGAPGVVPRFRKLNELSSAELASLVNARQRAIYGTDDRKDIRVVTDAKALRLADASVALVEAADLTERPGGGFKLRTSSYMKDYNLCPNEPFAKQPLGCFCSGVLVGEDVIATAGHCVKSTADLAHIRFVFGFRMIDEQAARTEFPADDVYAGKEVIDRKLTSGATDWALVRLDRKAVGHKPVTLRATGKIPNAESIFVIGHPCGLPQKLAGSATVRNNGNQAFFVANLDTYGGNSGSPVFSESSYQLEGLLVRGQTDFVSTGSCNVSLVFPTTGSGGEDVTRATEWAKLVAAQAPKKPGTPARGGTKRRTTRARKSGRSARRSRSPR